MDLKNGQMVLLTLVILWFYEIVHNLLVVYNSSAGVLTSNKYTSPWFNP